jgi:predicted PurR-regulated permease PerM
MATRCSRPEISGSASVTEPRLGPSARADRPRVIRAGITAWAMIGIAVVAAVALVVLNAFKLVVIPLGIALFPAALLAPIVRRFQRWGAPRLVSVAIVMVLFVVGLAVALLALVWLVFNELRAVLSSIDDAYVEIADFVQRRLEITLPPIDDLVARAQDWASGFDVGGTATSIAFTTLEIVTGTLLGVFALFFYLKDADRIRNGVVGLFPDRLHTDADAILRRVWLTIGGYFRGQLLVAAVDAVFIGIGLALLGVPLAFPLALLIFFGGLFPIVGAFVAGAVAVLVALGSGGLSLAIAVLVLNLVVQQLESNLLQPMIMSRITNLHPLAVIVAVTAGAATLGILGAFLAVPVVAAVLQALDEYRSRRRPEPALTRPPLA